MTQTDLFPQTVTRMPQKPICVKRREVYGNTLIYVCDPRQASILSRLTGKRTLSEQDLCSLRELGLVIQDIDADIAQLIKGA